MERAITTELNKMKFWKFFFLYVLSQESNVLNELGIFFKWFQWTSLSHLWLATCVRSIFKTCLSPCAGENIHKKGAHMENN